MQVNFTINIDDRIINFFRNLFKKKKLVFIVITIFASALVYAATITKPYNFATGDLIDADQINQNFDTLYTKVNELDGQVSSAETCPSDMVAVGDFCVDKYEASVWDSYTTDSSGTQYGASSDNYPCGDNGNDCSNIYARSVTGVMPSRYTTWFQAQQACLNSGKHLITNAEWQAAAAGTNDPGSNDGLTNTKCNTSATGPRNTGSAGSTAGGANDCISRIGAEDMVGNLWEWTADWFGADSSTNTLTTNAAYGDDYMYDVDPADTQGGGFNFPAAVIRGGNWGNGASAGVFAMGLTDAPSSWRTYLGFRCARRR